MVLAQRFSPPSLPEQQVAPPCFEPSSQAAVRADRTKARDAVMDHDVQLALEDFVDGALEHLVREIEPATEQERRKNISREYDRSLVGRAHPLHR